MTPSQRQARLRELGVTPEPLDFDPTNLPSDLDPGWEGWVPVTSSNVAAIRWHDDAQVLGVRFHNGGEYVYFNVSYKVWKDFLSAPSKGQYVWRVLRGAGYPFRKVG